MFQSPFFNVIFNVRDTLIKFTLITDYTVVKFDLPTEFDFQIIRLPCYKGFQSANRL